MKKIIYGFCLGVLFLSCKNNDIKEYRGNYTYGHEVRVFQDEETGVNYWLIGDKENLEKLNRDMREKIENKKEVYPNIKLKIKGIDEGKATNGLAEPEDRVLRVINFEILNK